MKKYFLGFICFVFIVGLNAEDTYKFPRLESDPVIQTFVTDNPPWQELFKIALWASGAAVVSDSEVSDPYTEKVNAIIKDLSSDLPKDQKEKAEYILDFLHKNVFKGYSVNQTRIDTLLTNGRYNCVSSAVIYAILAKYAGLEPKGVITKDHAFITITIDNEIIDIETTNKYGFDPGKRKDFQDDFGKLTGFAYTPPGNYKDRQTISLLELDSIILRNRIADLEKSNKFAESVPPAIDRVALLDKRKDPTVSALFADPNTELQDVLFNLGASYLNKKDERRSLAWADTIKSLSSLQQTSNENFSAKKFFVDEKRLKEYEVAAVNNMIAKDVRAKKFADARNDLQKNTARLDEKKTNELGGMILDAELTELVNNSKTLETTSVVLKKLDDAAAVGLIESKRINQLKQTVTQNRAAFYHNNFASLFNKKDFSGAEDVLNIAMQEFPNNKQFLSDQKKIETAKAILAKQ